MKEYGRNMEEYEGKNEIWCMFRGVRRIPRCNITLITEAAREKRGAT